MDTFNEGLDADVKIVLTLIVLFIYNFALKDFNVSLYPPMESSSLIKYYVIIFY